MDTFSITLLANLSAHRRLLISLCTQMMAAEAEPVAAAKLLRDTFQKSPTLAPEGGSGLDPVESDVLAAMTDEAIDDILERVIIRLEQGALAAASNPAPPRTRRRARTFGRSE